MPVFTPPYVFVNNTIADGTQVNADFNAVQSVLNGLDSANVGAGGFYASQIVPVSPATATFGGTQGYTFAPGGTSTTPVTIAGVTGQTAALLNVTVAGTRVMAVTPDGTITTTSAILATGNISSNAAVNGATVSVTGGTLGASQLSNDVNLGLKVTGTNMSGNFTGLAAQGTRPTLSLSAMGTGGQNWMMVSGDSGGFVAGSLTFYDASNATIAGYFDNAGALHLYKTLYTTNAIGAQFANVGTNGVQIIPNTDAQQGTFIVTNHADTLGLFRVDNVDANNATVLVSRSGPTGPGALGVLAPFFGPTGGAIANSLKVIFGNVNATLTTTNVTLTNAAVFNGSPMLVVQDLSTGAMVNPTGISTSTGVWPSTVGHLYAYLFFGV
jgi:hypothetical protein